MTEIGVSGQFSRTKFQVGESGDSPIIVLNNSQSEESSNDVYPWNRWIRRRNLNCTSSENGREVSSASFFLCTCAILLLVSSAGTFCVCGWSMLFRIPFVIVTDGKTQLLINIFSFVTALLNLPAFWLTWMIHNNKKNYVFLPLLIIVLIFAVGLSVASLTMGILNRKQLKLKKPHVLEDTVSTPYQDLINKTMYQTLALYQSSEKIKAAWDCTQIKLDCCGVKSHHDWLGFNMTVPDSCYTDSSNMFLKHVGCLSQYCTYLHWEIQVILVAIFTDFVVQIITVLVATFVYF